MLQENKPHDFSFYAQYAGYVIALLVIGWKNLKTFRTDHKTGEQGRIDGATKGFRERAEVAEGLAESRKGALTDITAALDAEKLKVQELTKRLREKEETEVTLQSRVNNIQGNLDAVVRRVASLEGDRR